MASVKNLPIGTRLGAGFALVMAGIVLVGILGVVGLLKVQAEYDRMSEDYLVKVMQLRDSQDNTNTIARSIRNIALSTNANVRTAESERIAKARQANNEIVAKLEKEITSEKGKALLKAATETRAKYSADLDKTLGLLLAGKDAEGREMLFAELRNTQLAYMASVTELVKFQQEMMKKAGDDVESAVKQAEILMFVVAAVIIALGVVVAWWITRSVTVPVGKAAALAETIAAGDLTSRIEVDSTDEVGRLLASMKKMNESLQKLVGDVRMASDSIATGSTQIATGTQDLSSRTEEQASNLQETAASMEQLTATVKQSAESATQANQLAGSASAAAATGGEVVGKVVKTMEQITTQSHKIAEIINVIDGIAFQTNILALNASVEAARAGEQGRGFAVVAGEVRNLAQRAAQAAREIKTLINASVEQIENGGHLVNEAGKTMNEIVGQVKQVTDLIGEITAASREESTGINQINEAVTQMDQVTQQNAALVEESAAAADSLKAEAQRLAQAVSVFRVSGMASGSFTAHSEPVHHAAPAHKPAAKPVRKAGPAKPVAAHKPEPKAEPKPATAGGPTGKTDDWEEF